MPLYKKQPFPLAEKPNDLMPNERVFQVHVTNELFRDYSEYLKRINLYRRRVWTSKASGKTNLTYEEALVSEKKAAEKVRQFPKEFVAPVLREVQFMCSRKRKKAEDEKTLRGHIQTTTEVCSRKREKAEDEKTLPGQSQTTTEVCSRKRGKAEDEKTLHGQSQSTAEVCSGKREKAEDEKTLPGQSQTTTEVCSRKRKKVEDEKRLSGQSETTTEVCRKRIKAEDEKTLPSQSQTTTEVCSRKKEKAEDEKTLPSQSQTTTEVCSGKREKAEDEKTLPGQSQTTTEVCRRKRKKAEDEKTLSGQNQTTTEVCSRKREKAEDEKTLPCPSQTTTEDVPAPDILIKKMPTHKQGHEDANDGHVKASKDIPQSKKLRVKAAEKSSDEQKEPLDDPITGTICQPRFVPVEQTGNFSKLPYELLVEVAKRLKLLEDFTCFRSVSRSLHLCVEEEYFEGLRLRKSLPYLMLPPVSSTDDNDDIRQLYSLVEGESIVASLKLPGFKTKMCFESLGWLLTVDVDGSMSLLDPFSYTEISVPHLNTIPRLVRFNLDKRVIIRRMVLSSRPNENSDFILMVIIGDLADLAFWRLGDKAWNNIDDRRRCFCDIVYGGGEQFYAISTKGVIWVINLAAGHVECRIIVDCGAALIIGLSQNLYILKAINGSMLFIKRTKNAKFYVSSEFQVYDIDMETGKWTQIYTLGSMAVFIGRNSSFSVDATASNGGVIKANHIYFTDDFVEFQHVYFNYSDWRSFAGNSPYITGGSVDIGVLNFQTGDIVPVYPVEPLLTNVSPAMWITPNLCI